MLEILYSDHGHGSSNKNGSIDALDPQFDRQANRLDPRISE
jgi:hypothetical protein